MALVDASIIGGAYVPCDVCGESTCCRLVVGDGHVPLCSDECERAWPRMQSLRRDVERLTRERDAAYASALRSDEVHAEAMRAVRARAERAEAERDEARASLARCISVAHEGGWNGVENPKALWDFLAGLTRDLTAARAQVERLRGVLWQRAVRSESYSMRCMICLMSWTGSTGEQHTDECPLHRAALDDAKEE